MCFQRKTTEVASRALHLFYFCLLTAYRNRHVKKLKGKATGMHSIPFIPRKIRRVLFSHLTSTTSLFKRIVYLMFI